MKSKFFLLATLLLPLTTLSAEVSELVVNDPQKPVPYLGKATTINNIDQIHQIITSGHYAWATNTIPSHEDGATQNIPVKVAFYNGHDWQDAVSLATENPVANIYPAYSVTHQNANAWLVSPTEENDNGRLFHFDSTKTTWSQGPLLNELFSRTDYANQYTYQFVAGDGIAYVVERAYASNMPMRYVFKHDSDTTWSTPQTTPAINWTTDNNVTAGITSDNHPYLAVLAADGNNKSALFKIDDSGHLTNETNQLPAVIANIEPSNNYLLVDNSYKFISTSADTTGKSLSYLAYNNPQTNNQWLVSSPLGADGVFADLYSFDTSSEANGLALVTSDPFAKKQPFTMWALDSNIPGKAWSAPIHFNNLICHTDCFPNTSIRGNNAWIAFGDTINATQSQPKVFSYNSSTGTVTDTKFQINGRTVWNGDIAVAPISIDNNRLLTAVLEFDSEQMRITSVNLYYYKKTAKPVNWYSVDTHAIANISASTPDNNRSNIDFQGGEKFWLFNDDSVYNSRSPALLLGKKQLQQALLHSKQR